MTRRRRHLGTCLLGLALPLAIAAPAHGQEPAATAASEPEPEATWRFKKKDKPVKVVVLAGSIGAWPRDPYAKQFANLCKNVEVKNLSKTGYGAYQLKKRFKQQVLENRYLRLHKAEADGWEYWLVFQGGLNSVGNPQSTNHHIRNLFEMAYKRGIKSVALSLTPWGAEDDKRWRGLRGVRMRRKTLGVVDFVLGTLSPAEALGSHAKKRKVDADAPWAPGELPEVAVDLYRSSLRDADAELRDVEAMRKEIQRDKDWKRRHKDLSPEEREQAVERDVQEAVQIPRWYMREELRSFDHIHPNTTGHREIAVLACPKLPESWGCTCPELPPQPSSGPEQGAAGDNGTGAADGPFGRTYHDWGWLLLRALTGTLGVADAVPADLGGAP